MRLNWLLPSVLKARLPRAICGQLTPDRVDAVRRLTLGTVAGNFLAGTMVVLACAPHLPLAPLLCWLGGLLLIGTIIAIDATWSRRAPGADLSRDVAKQVAAAAAFSLPWGVFCMFTLGILPHDAEIVLVGAVAAMASNGTIYRAPIPQAAFVYIALMLLPIGAKCFLIGYTLLAILIIGYIGFLTAIILVTARFWRDRAEVNARSAMLIANFPGGVIMANPAGGVSIINDTYGALLSVTAAAPTIIGADLAAHLDTHLGARCAAPASRAALSQLLQGIRQRRAVQVEIELDPDLVVSCVGQATADGGYIAVFKDITDTYREAKRDAHLARHDALTGLYNRKAFGEALAEACKALATHGTPFALLALDLDRFKEVNDTLGHPVGDDLLVAVAGRLSRMLREGDIVARLGGDEFMILLRSAWTQGAARQVGIRLQQRLEEPYQLGAHTVRVGASLGLAVAGHDAETPEAIMAAADRALYQDKIRPCAAPDAA